MYTEEDKIIIEKRFEILISASKRCQDEENRNYIRKAFDFAVKAHEGMRRRSGEAFIVHPIDVAIIAAEELGLGSTSIVSALLHDVVEDTEFTVDDIEKYFSKKVAQIVEGLTKLTEAFDQRNTLAGDIGYYPAKNKEIYSLKSKQAENFRKLILTLSDDIRVIFIKLADRLHNMRTLASMPENKQLKIAGETLFFFAPLAHRLGLYAIKTELEDLSFKYRHAKAYKEIRDKVKKDEKSRIRLLNKFALPIGNRLHEENIRFDITSRPKSIYSIWRKMKEKSVTFNEVYDNLAVRIVFDSDKTRNEKSLCWHIYTKIAEVYKPHPERIRDWVSLPKANGYEALHATFMGPEGKWIEVQIRSRRMDEIAERGYASHWKYKGMQDNAGELDKWIKTIRESLENPNQNALEFLDNFKLNLFSDEIVVFTPKGHIKSLPKNATILDFAFDIHTTVAYKCIAAKVNMKLVDIGYKLNSGDQVEIITSDKQKPQENWLDLVVTAKARSKLKHHFNKERKIIVETGRRIFDTTTLSLKIKPDKIPFKRLYADYDIDNKENLFFRVGKNEITEQDLQKTLKRKDVSLIKYWQLNIGKRKKEEEEENKPQQKELFDKKKTYLIEDKTRYSAFELAQCCEPIPGDDVMGFYDPEEQTITIHKTNCPRAIDLNAKYGDYTVKANWGTMKLTSFLTTIKLSGIDELGMLHNITSLISKQMYVNMQAINISSNKGFFDGTINLYVHNAKDLKKVISNLKTIKGIKLVKRLERTTAINI